MKCRFAAQINTAKDVDHDVVIGIGFLTSYEHMGMAYLECREGCKCKRKELQGMIDVKASQTDWCAGVSVSQWLLLRDVQCCSPNPAA